MKTGERIGRSYKVEGNFGKSWQTVGYCPPRLCLGDKKWEFADDFSMCVEIVFTDRETTSVKLNMKGNLNKDEYLSYYNSIPLGISREMFYLVIPHDFLVNKSDGFQRKMETGPNIARRHPSGLGTCVETEYKDYGVYESIILPRNVKYRCVEIDPKGHSINIQCALSDPEFLKEIRYNAVVFNPE